MRRTDKLQDHLTFCKLQFLRILCCFPMFGLACACSKPTSSNVTHHISLVATQEVQDYQPKTLLLSEQELAVIRHVVAVYDPQTAEQRTNYFAGRMVSIATPPSKPEFTTIKSIEVLDPTSVEFRTQDFEGISGDVITLRNTNGKWHVESVGKWYLAR